MACGKSTQVESQTDKKTTWSIEPSSISFSSQEGTKSIVVSTNGDWSSQSTKSWCEVSPTKGHNGETKLDIYVSANHLTVSRSAQIEFTSKKGVHTYNITQEASVIENYVPEGYTKVWEEEFNIENQDEGKSSLPNTNKWWYETAEPGWVNNELQKYVAGTFNDDTVSYVSDGTLKIIAKKSGDNIISARLNTHEGWTYGYFEARLKVAGGKGTWPAFWMMPKEYTSWPDDGEIDIMEYVGYRPNVVQSSIHTKSYNHVQNTEKTATKTIEGAETEFHIYAVEWTSDYIKGFVDGEEYFHFENDKQNNPDTWPFNKPFYIKLNLAWGGDWGGSQGIDDNKLPATYKIDYVRVYQKE